MIDKRKEVIEKKLNILNDDSIIEDIENQWEQMKKSIYNKILKVSYNTVDNIEILVVIHGGKFHADDVLCIAMLKYFYPNIHVIRTRNIKVLKELNITPSFVLDVGYKNIVSDHYIAFDHHQDDAFIRSNGVKAAACGLLADWLFEDYPVVWQKLHSYLLAPIECADNGQMEFDLGQNLLSFVSMLNPTWEEGINNTDIYFNKNVDMAKRVFHHILLNIRAEISSDNKLNMILNETKDGIVILRSGMNWREIINERNKELKEKDKFKLVIFRSSKTNYVVQVIPYTGAIIPMQWRGKSGDVLERYTGIRGSNFCTENGLSIGFSTFDGAKAAAYKILERSKETLENIRKEQERKNQPVLSKYERRQSFNAK